MPEAKTGFGYKKKIIYYPLRMAWFHLVQCNGFG